MFVHFFQAAILGGLFKKRPEPRVGRSKRQELRDDKGRMDGGSGLESTYMVIGLPLQTQSPH